MNLIRNSFKNVYTLSVLGAKEWLYLRFFHLLLFFAVFLLLFGYLLSSLTFAVQDRLFYDFSFAGFELCLIFLTVAVGSHGMQREIERRTIYVLMTRPLPKWNLVISMLGSIKILSLIFCLFFILSLTTTSSLVHLGRTAPFLSVLLFTFLIYLKSLVVASFVVVLSLLVRPVLSFVVGLCYWLLAYSIPDLQFFLKKSGSQALDYLAQALNFILPQFYLMNWKSFEFLIQVPTQNQILWAVFHCLGWILFWAALSSILFQRKEIG